MEAWKRGWIQKRDYQRERERARKSCGSEHAWSEPTFYCTKSGGEEWIATCSRCSSLRRELRAPRADGRVTP